MTKILIPNSFTWYSKGDTGIVLGMVYAIRQYIPDAEITVLSFTPETDGEKYNKYGVRVLRHLLAVSPRASSPKFISVAKLLTKILRYSLWSRVNIPVASEEKEILNAYADADIVLSCGGGFLGGHDIASLLHVYGIYFAKLLGKPVIIYGQSIDPFGNVIISTITKFALNRVDLITVREQLSLDYLKSLALKPKVILTADAAFLVKSISPNEATKLLAEEGVYKSQRPLVGISVRGWNFPEYSDGKLRFANYLEVMTKTVEYLVSTLDATVVFFPQTTSPLWGDDLIVSNEIASRIENDSNVKVLAKDYSPEQFKGMIGQMGLFIGTRMHSNIFALSMGVPTVAISYQVKTKGMMSMLGEGDYVLDMANLTFDDMVSAIGKAWDNHSKIKQQLTRKIPEIENLALYNAELVKSFLAQTK